YTIWTANVTPSAARAIRTSLTAWGALYSRSPPPGAFGVGVRAGMRGGAPGFVAGVLGEAPIPWAPVTKIAARGAESAAEDIATGAAKRGITAYHGSPYSFHRFDISKLG